MAGKRRRVDSYEDRMVTGYEFDGNAARQLELQPQEVPEHRKKRRTHSARRYSVSRGYVIFIALACVSVMAFCVMYLSRKATITTQYETLAQLENDYNELKSNNDAKYNEVMDSVSLEDIKEAAQGRLGMSYAGADQIIYYELAEDSYVRQYKDVPDE